MNEEVIRQNELTSRIRDEMFDLFTAYYDAVSRSIFEEDLSNKDLVILLRGADRTLVGFTTLSIHEMNFRSRRICYVYSGDTIMDFNYWGPGHLLRSWFRVVGSIRAQHPQAKLYWMLLVKGHRTYRILNSFFRYYVPRVAQQPDPDLIELRDEICKKKFGEHFDSSTGLITFPSSRGHLIRQLQDEEASANRPPVSEFMKLNPYSGQGVELACIAELDEDNLKSYAKVEFGRGMREQPRSLA